MAVVEKQDREYKGLFQQLDLLMGRRRKVRILLKMSKKKKISEAVTKVHFLVLSTCRSSWCEELQLSIFQHLYTS